MKRIRSTLFECFVSWRKQSFSQVKKRNGFITILKAFLARYSLVFYFRVLRKYSYINMIQRKLGLYTERQRLTSVWNAWKACKMRRATQRFALVTICTDFQKHHAHVLRLSFATWRVSISLCQKLDTSTTGRRVFRHWHALYRATSFRDASLRRRALRAWRRRVHMLHTARTKVFKLKRAIAIFESRYEYCST